MAFSHGARAGIYGILPASPPCGPPSRASSPPQLCQFSSPARLVSQSPQLGQIGTSGVHPVGGMGWRKYHQALEGSCKHLLYMTRNTWKEVMHCWDHEPLSKPAPGLAPPPKTCQHCKKDPESTLPNQWPPDTGEAQADHATEKKVHLQLTLATLTCCFSFVRSFVHSFTYAFGTALLWF